MAGISDYYTPPEDVIKVPPPPEETITVPPPAAPPEPGGEQPPPAPPPAPPKEQPQPQYPPGEFVPPPTVPPAAVIANAAGKMPPELNPLAMQFLQALGPVGHMLLAGLWAEGAMRGGSAGNVGAMGTAATNVRYSDAVAAAEEKSLAQRGVGLSDDEKKRIQDLTGGGIAGVGPGLGPALTSPGLTRATEGGGGNRSGGGGGNVIVPPAQQITIPPAPPAVEPPIGIRKPVNGLLVLKDTDYPDAMPSNAITAIDRILRGLGWTPTGVMAPRGSVEYRNPNGANDLSVDRSIIDALTDETARPWVLWWMTKTGWTTGGTWPPAWTPPTAPTPASRPQARLIGPPVRITVPRAVTPVRPGRIIVPAR